MNDAVEVAKTESAFREVNEAIADTAAKMDADEAEFVCECADVECAHRIEAQLEEYERVRKDPTRFLLKLGHERPRWERIVGLTPRYAIVEKFESTVALIARRLDPRAERA